MNWLGRRAALLAGAIILSAGGTGFAAAPPGQPAKGPGGTSYVSADVIKKAYGAGSAQALVFRPAAAGKEPRPLVVFLHGPAAVSPKFYGAWIEHLARSGAVVLYPRYEEDVGRTAFTKMTDEAVKGIKAGLAGLADESDVKVDLSKVVFVGHSGGAVLAANLAALAPSEGLPAPKLVFGVMPKKSAPDQAKGFVLGSLAGLDPKTVLVMLVGDRDQVAGEGGARQIIKAASGLPIERRLLVKVGSDNHGQPALFAGHYSPIAPNAAYDLAAIPGANDPAPADDASKGRVMDRAARERARKDAAELWRTGYEERQLLPMYEGQILDPMDWLGFWRPFDIARDNVLAGGDALSVKRDTRLYDMGQWSDGWPVRRLNTESPKSEAAPADDKSSSEAAPAAVRPGAKGRS